MNKKIVRLLCLLLTCAALLPAVVSCGKKKKQPVNTQEITQEEMTDEYSAHIAQMGVKNYEGRDFVIATRNTPTDSFFTLLFLSLLFWKTFFFHIRNLLKV